MYAHQLPDQSQLSVKGQRSVANSHHVQNPMLLPRGIKLSFRPKNLICGLSHSKKQQQLVWQVAVVPFYPYTHTSTWSLRSPGTRRLSARRQPKSPAMTCWLQQGWPRSTALCKEAQDAVTMAQKQGTISPPAILALQVSC